MGISDTTELFTRLEVGYQKCAALDALKEGVMGWNDHIMGPGYEHLRELEDEAQRYADKIKEMAERDETWRKKKEILENDLGVAWKEITRLRAIESRAGDVGKIAYIAEDAGVVGMVSWNGIARAVSAYLLGKEGK